VRVASGAEALIREVDAVVGSGAAGPSMAVSRAMEPESWDRKVSEMEALVEERLAATAARRAS
jgi:hypothetical protein